MTKPFLFLTMILITLQGSLFAQYQTGFTDVKNIEFSQDNQLVTITYDLIGEGTGNDYFVMMEAYYKSGTRIVASSFTGDINYTQPGINKKIYWNLAGDGLELDDDVYIKLNVNVSLKMSPTLPSLGGSLFKSTIYPGWGSYQYSKKGRAFITGLVGIASVAGAVYFDHESRTHFDSYQRSSTFGEANDHYNNSLDARNKSLGFTGLAVATWTVSLSDVMIKHSRASRRAYQLNTPVSPDPATIPRENLISATSGVKHINNRISVEPAQLTIERGSIEFLEVNVDKVIEPYEPCFIRFRLKNTGQGRAFDLIAMTEESNNLPGIYYEKEIFAGNLDPGASTVISLPLLGNREMVNGTAQFRIVVKEANGQKSDPVEVRVATIEDEAYRVLISEINNVSQNLHQQLVGFTDNLIRQGTISENVATNVNAEVKTSTNDDGEHQLNLHVEYEYEVKRSFVGGNDDFAPGKFEITDSRAANATMTVFKRTVEEELRKYLNRDTQVTIKITGTTDATPVRNKIEYNNVFGDLTNQPYYDREELLARTNITRETGITSNEQLGYLRTYSVRDYITNLVAPFKFTQNHFEHHVLVATEAGAQHRRISIELIIHNPFQELEQKQEDAVRKFDETRPVAEEETPIDVDVNIPEIGGQRPKTYALVIGNEDYSKYQPGGGQAEVNVEFANRDAEIFAQYLEKTLGVPKENITLLTDAISSQMTREIEKLTNMAKYGGNEVELIFYYAGHGSPHEETKEGYLMPVDIIGTEVEKGIKLNDLYKKLTENNPHKVTVFIDACFSGGGRTNGLLAARAVRVRPNPNVINGNIVIFTASSGTQTSLPYKEKKHGVFTYYLLKGLQMNRGKISYQELSDYIVQNVQLTSAQINYKDQNPETLYSSTVEEVWRQWELR